MTNLKIGNKVVFRAGATHVVGNGEYDIAGLSGIVKAVDPRYVSIKLLSIRFEELLSEWEGCLEWSDNEGVSAIDQALEQIEPTQVE